MMMKRFFVFLLAAVAVLGLVAGCDIFPIVEGSGFPMTYSFLYSNFTRVEASTGFKVHIVPDTVYSVDVTCDDNLSPYLAVDTLNDTLRLSLQSGYNYSAVILSAEVHMPTLAGLTFTGASKAKVDAGFSSSSPLSLNASEASSIELNGISCSTATATLSGTSSVTILSITASSLSSNISGSSILSAGGSLASESLVVTGASSVDLMDLVASQATVSLSGSSESWVNVGTGRITLSASEASTLYYRGSPSFTIYELTGSSEIVRVY